MTETHQKDFSSKEWEAYALCYDSLRKLKPYTDMLSYVTSRIPTDHKLALLDASCGTGNFEETFLSHPHHKETTILGVDSSEEMLRIAEAKCKHSEQVHFLKANLNEPLMFPQETFSHVVSINTLYAVKNPQKTLSEFFRVLKPSGELLLVTPKHDFENGLILKEHAQSTLPDEFWKNAHASPLREESLIRQAIQDENTVSDMLTIAMYNRLIASNSLFHFFLHEELMNLLKEIGFTITHTSLTYAHQDIFVIAKKGI